MEKEFISYEEALALKELGFDEPCFGWFRSTLIPSNFTEYFLETEFGMNESPSDWVNNNFLDKACSAPLYQQAFRWFRENYRYDVAIKKRRFEIQKLEIYGESDPDYYFTDFPFDSYEESQLKCLKKLIEIVKRKNNFKS